ncbi:hypothetical protein SprV_0200857500 [Sparganum proliferum]
MNSYKSALFYENQRLRELRKESQKFQELSLLKVMTQSKKVVLIDACAQTSSGILRTQNAGDVFISLTYC